MNPLLSEALGSILRWILAGAAGWLVQHGIWTQSQSQTYVMAAALAVISLGWSLWQKYKSRVNFLTALELPAGSDEAAVKAKVANGTGAPLVVFLLAAVLGAGVMASSCGPRPISIVTPAGKVAYTADQITVRVSEFQNAVIQAEASGGLTTAQARVYVEWTVSAGQMLKATRSGWQATLAASWTTVKGKVPIPTTPAGLAVVAGMDAAIASLGGVR